MVEASGVLLAEDSDDDALFFRHAMKEVGAEFPLQVVSDGPTALAYLSGGPRYSDRGRFPMLLDLKLPKLSASRFSKASARTCRSGTSES